MIFPAMKTGRLKVISGAMARELLVDSSGKVRGVSYVDKATRTDKVMKCKAVIVAASACESARLLLNSKSTKYPNGIAKGSGEVGRNLTDTVGHAVTGIVPALEGTPRHNSDGIGGMSFRNVAARAEGYGPKLRPDCDDGWTGHIAGHA